MTSDDIYEPFVFADNVGATSGVTLEQYAATKLGYPIVPPLSTGHDALRSFASVQTLGANDWRMHHYSIASGQAYLNYATSINGLLWNKPNLGLVTYGGNTNNNIVQETSFAGMNYDEATDTWVMVTANVDGVGGVGDPTSVWVWTASSPTGSFTMVKQLDAGYYSEGKFCFRRSDGKWIAYQSSGHSGNNRRISAWLSDTTDITGDWTLYADVIGPVSSSAQPYGIGVRQIGGVFYGLVMVYDSTTDDGIIRLDLYASQSGVNDWSLVVEDFVPIGDDGAWDDEMVINAHRLVDDGHNWHVYYCGAPLGHNDANTFVGRAYGRATVGWSRVCGYAGSGTVTTTVLPVLSGYTASTLSVNADASGGSINIEVRDAAGDPIAGYTVDDFDTITSDVYDLEPTWGGETLPQVENLQLHFVITTATLHSYTIART